MSIPACRYIRSFSSWYWIPPATCPSVSTTKRTDEPPPRRSSSIAATGSGSPHHRDTDGSAKIARNRGASPGRPGRSLTRRPANVGRASAWAGSPSVAMNDSVPPPPWPAIRPLPITRRTTAGHAQARPPPILHGRADRGRSGWFCRWLCRGAGLAASTLACRLTCAFVLCLEGECPSGGFPHVVAGCGVPVFRPWRPAGPGLAGFRRTGRAGGRRADVSKPPADAGRGEPPGWGGAFPGQAQVVGQRPGQAELGVDRDDEPGPPVRGGRVADLGGGPAEDLLEQAEGVFQVEAAQERLPQPVHLTRGGAGGRGP